jgi:hypothetical protein
MAGFPYVCFNAPYKCSLTLTLLSSSIVDVVNAMQPPPYSNMAKGSPGAGQASDVQYTIRYDPAQAEKVFGLGKEIKYRTLQETAQDTLLGFKAKGLEL